MTGVRCRRSFIRRLAPRNRRLLAEALRDRLTPFDHEVKALIAKRLSRGEIARRLVCPVEQVTAALRKMELA